MRYGQAGADAGEGASFSERDAGVVAVSAGDR